MGLLNELNTINRTLENNQKIITKQQKEEEKAKNKIYVAKIELLDDLTDEIKISLKYNHDPNNSKIRNEIIEAILGYSNIIYNKQYTRAFLIENYPKIATKEIKLYKEKQKELDKIQIESKQEEAKQRQQKTIARQQTFNAIITILHYAIILLATPFILIIAFVFGICKSIK